ncbi:restriction endonuclease subunit S [Acinetobacter lwoffii]|jgi:type I restriction enzyme S subunit|uniref:restriction endonuclease subunit S n=1 Tax=Acinetobacter lwoffii TaxID=28090 RepID=UPI003F8DAB04
MSYPKMKLGDCTEIFSGSTPRTNNPDFWDGDIIWVTPKDLSKLKSKFISKTESKITQLGFDSCSTKLLPENSVLFSSRAPIGHVAINTVPMCTNQGFKSFVPKSNLLDAQYLYYWLKANKEYLQDLGVGATFKEISKTVIANVEIPLPPINEQRRIASILDKADELRQKRQQAIEKLDQLLQATFIDMFGDPVSNPKGFKVAKLAEQVDLIQIGPFGTQLHQEDYIENGIPLINPSHIKNGKIIPNDKLTVSKSKHEELTQYHLRLNDVLLGRRGEMGRCAVVTEKEVGWLCGTGSLFIRPNREKINPFFLELLLSSDSIKKYLENVSQGQTMANLNKSIVGAIPLILPSIEIQNKFFIISEKIDKMKSEFKNAKNRANNLFESLQNQAFSGNL